MHPLSRVAAVMAGVLTFLAVLTGLFLGGSWKGPFRIDEAHKISETAFLRLWLEGDVQNDAWFANVIDRTNPPAGKYLFGGAILISGQELPVLPTLAVHSPEGDIPSLHPDELSAPYRVHLTAVRAASAVCVALTIALLAMTLTRYHGWLAALTACGLCFMHPLTRSYATTAVFDPLFALLFAACIPLVAMAARPVSSRRIAGLAASIGIVTSLAFQTRLNGLLAGLVALPFLWFAISRDSRKTVMALAIALPVYGATTLAVNPFYWSVPETVIAPFSSQAGPLRPLDRLLHQKEDLEGLTAALREKRPEGRGLAARVQYAVVRMGTDPAGALLLLGAAAGAVLPGVRRQRASASLRVALLMSMAMAVTMIVTLPMPWQRYLLVVIPPLALMAGYGIAEVVRTGLDAAGITTDPDR